MNIDEAKALIQSYIDLDESESEVYAQCERVKRLIEREVDPLDVDGLIADHLHRNYHR